MGVPGSNSTAEAAQAVQQGAILFATTRSVEEGLGPLYNASSCISCHSTPAAGGMGLEGLGLVVRVGRLTDSGFDPLVRQGGPVARAHSVTELGFPCQLQPGIPAGANVTSVRNAPALFEAGLIDAVPDDVIRAGAIPRGDGVQGHPNVVRTANGDERVGRFGWKGATPSLALFVAEALQTELGITSPLAPVDSLQTDRSLGALCAGDSVVPEDDGTMVDALTAYLRSLSAEGSGGSQGDPIGERVFDAIGCAACHVANLQADGREFGLYSDLLLHDMGPALDDGFIQGQAQGRDWRTTPLWGMATRNRFLHDGRARTLTRAILAHGGEADAASQRFGALAPADRDALLAFVASR
jgi:CxxC motif-containing protein (DUF1111 family)